MKKGGTAGHMIKTPELEAGGRGPLPTVPITSQPKAVLHLEQWHKMGLVFRTRVLLASSGQNPAMLFNSPSLTVQHAPVSTFFIPVNRREAGKSGYLTWK